MLIMMKVMMTLTLKLIVDVMVMLTYIMTAEMIFWL